MLSLSFFPSDRLARGYLGRPRPCPRTLDARLSLSSLPEAQTHQDGLLAVSTAAAGARLREEPLRRRDGAQAVGANPRKLIKHIMIIIDY